MNETTNNEITNSEITNNEITNSEITNLAISLLEVQSSNKRIETLIRAISDKKATNIVILDLREIVSFTDYFILCSGRATRQVQAIADEAQDQLRKEGCRTSHIEGYQKAEWILMDYGDFVVHIFGQEAREFYNLERLWRDAKRTEIKDEV